MVHRLTHSQSSNLPSRRGSTLDIISVLVLQSIARACRYLLIAYPIQPALPTAGVPESGHILRAQGDAHGRDLVRD